VHDLGRGPFSHAFEKIGERFDLKMVDHEAVSDLLIRDSEVSKELREMGSGFANDVAEAGAAGRLSTQPSLRASSMQTAWITCDATA
jgi:HD superfamily phosphohydrolase